MTASGIQTPAPARPAEGLFHQSARGRNVVPQRTVNAKHAVMVGAARHGSGGGRTAIAPALRRIAEPPQADRSLHLPRGSYPSPRASHWTVLWGRRSTASALMETGLGRPPGAESGFRCSHPPQRRSHRGRPAHRRGLPRGAAAAITGERPLAPWSDVQAAVTLLLRIPAPPTAAPSHTSRRPRTAITVAAAALAGIVHPRFDARDGGS